MKTVIALEKFHENVAYLNLKCRSTTNSLYVCKWFEWIGHNTVTGFCHGCTHNRPSLRIRSSLFRRKRKNSLTWMNMEPSLHVCGITQRAWRIFETRVESAFARPKRSICTLLCYFLRNSGTGGASSEVEWLPKRLWKRYIFKTPFMIKGTSN